MIGRIGEYGCCGKAVWGAYGEGEGTPAEPAAPQSSADYYTDFASKTTQIFAPIVGQLTDPVRQVETLKVQILNAKIRGASMQTIATLQAKLIAAQRNADLRMEGEKASREWRIVGQLGVVSGMVVAGAVTLYILARIFRGT